MALPDQPNDGSPPPESTNYAAADRGRIAVPPAVRAARALLPLLYGGQDVDIRVHRLADEARAVGDADGECAALYTALAAASMGQNRTRAKAISDELTTVASAHGLSAWESTGRQYLARLALADGHEDLALTEVVTAELLIDDAPPSVALCVALNGMALSYSRLGLFEDGERVFARLAAVAVLVDDAWIHVALTYNRLLNQASWGLALERQGSREEAQQRLRIAAAQARGDALLATSDARHDFGALYLFTELMIEDVEVDAARARLPELALHGSAEPVSFVHLALAHRLADAGAIEEARTHIDAGLATLHRLEGEPVGSMLAWERARIAVLAEPDHVGLRDAWTYAQLATGQVWELRLRRREAASDRLRIGRMRRVHEQVERASLEDPLTGTANRRRLDRERAAMLSAAPGTWITVVYADLDDFKRINDTYGHEVGDAVLREFGQLLQASTRDIDLVGRYGGDEFIVIARDCPATDAGILAQRLLDAVRNHRWEQLHPELGIRTSLGLATAGQGHHRLFPSADEALYDAKRSGRDNAEHRTLD